MNNTTLIIDASVFAKWFLADEKNRTTALQLKKDYTEGKISISIPSITFYEISNLLRTSVMRSRLSREQAIIAYAGFLQIDLTSYELKSLLKEILETAITYNISSYDASYVSLSEQLEIPFYTADEKLLNKVSNHLVKHLSEYSPFA